MTWGPPPLAAAAAAPLGLPKGPSCRPGQEEEGGRGVSGLSTRAGRGQPAAALPAAALGKHEQLARSGHSYLAHVLQQHLDQRQVNLLRVRLALVVAQRERRVGQLLGGQRLRGERRASAGGVILLVRLSQSSESQPGIRQAKEGEEKRRTRQQTTPAPRTRR